jgi:general secretion pathway protein C
MDRFLEHYRRYYWAANGLLVLAIAYVVAGIGVRVAVDRFVPMPAPAPRAAPVVKSDRPATFADYQVVLSRNLLNAKVEEAAPVVDQAALDDAPVKATIQATLLGTVAGPAKYAFAIVSASGKNEVVRIGERIANAAEVLEIHRGRIVIMNNGRKEELSMYDEKPLPGNADLASRPESRMPVAMPSETNASPEVSVRQTSDNTFEIDQTEFEQMTTNLGPLLTQARVVPHFEAGAINGYKIFAIKPDSLYMKIGLENGDVIQSINGIKVDSPEKALQMFQSLRTERNFNINLSRNGSPLTFNYNLR